MWCTCVCVYVCCSRFFSIILFDFVSTLWLFLVQLDIYPFLQTHTHTAQSNSHAHTQPTYSHLTLFPPIISRLYYISFSVHTFSIALALSRIWSVLPLHIIAILLAHSAVDSLNLFFIFSTLLYVMCFNMVLSCLSGAFVAIVVVLYVTLCMAYRHSCIYVCAVQW